MRRVVAIAFLLLLTASAFGQEAEAPCARAETVGECISRIREEAAKATTAATSEQTANDVAAANTGITNLQSASASSLKDFLSLLSASLESATLEDDGQALTFDWNPRIDFLGIDFGDRRPFKLQAVFTNGTLNSQLQTALASNATALKDLDESLAFEDDVAVSATFTRNSEIFGRSIAPHRDYYQNWLEAAMTANVNAADDDAFDALLISLPNVTQNTRFDSITDPSRQETARRLVAQHARSLHGTDTAIRQFHDAFAKLLNNQSQVYISGTYNARRNVVGPNEFRVKGTFEWGPENLTTFKRNNSLCTDATIVTNAVQCSTDLVEYAKNAAKDRLAISVDYARTNRRWIDLPDLGVAFGIPRATAYTYSLTYGRTLRTATANTGGRIDFGVHFEDNEEKNIDDREKIALTYTYKVSDGVNVPFSVIYATDDDDLVDADRKFSANFGLVFKVPKELNLFGGD